MPRNSHAEWATFSCMESAELLRVDGPMQKGFRKRKQHRTKFNSNYCEKEFEHGNYIATVSRRKHETTGQLPRRWRGRGDRDVRSTGEHLHVRNEPST